MDERDKLEKVINQIFPLMQELCRDEVTHVVSSLALACIPFKARDLTNDDIRENIIGIIEQDGFDDILDGMRINYD